MGQIEIRCAAVGMLGTNCYIVYDQELKEALVADPGGDAQYLIQLIEKLEVKVAAILLTHGHGDHFQALQELKNRYKVPVYVHEDDVYRLKCSDGYVHAEYAVSDDDIYLHDNDHISLGGMEIDVIHTPGHTEGGVCYYFKENGILLAGDTMFFHSWGRTDFKGGDGLTLMRSIREKLLLLPPETIVLPGHEGSTTIEEERKTHRYNL